MSTRLKLALLLVLGVLPAGLSLLTAGVAFERTKTTDFCASCHVMTEYTDDLRARSETLASQHHQNRWIAKDDCYTCHTDYDFLGPISAKLNGMRHVAAYYWGEPRPIELYKPYDAGICLQCHGSTPGYVESDTHEVFAAEIAAGEMSCSECHGPVHPSHRGEEAQ